jgi:hypothetical protein
MKSKIFEQELGYTKQDFLRTLIRELWAEKELIEKRIWDAVNELTNGDIDELR